VRLWGRWWLGLLAVAIAAVASGPAESALAAAAPPVSVSAEAVTVLAPGSAAQGSGVATVSGPAVRGSYRDPQAPGTVHAGWTRATAGMLSAIQPAAQAYSVAHRVRLVGGAVEARKVWVSISVSSTATTTSGRVQGLVVLGRHVHAVAGKTLTLAKWGVLTVLASPKASAGAPVVASVTGLQLTLLQDHGGLDAGTVVDIGTAEASIPANAPSAPSAPQRTHGATLHPGLPVRTTASPHHRRTHRPARHHTRPARHHARARHPAPRIPLPRSSRALIAAAAGGRARVIAAALDQVGWPYIWGGDSRAEGGFDCSGLVDYAYARAGMTLPGRPTAAILWQLSAPVSRGRLEPGDLAFLYSRERAPYHVALYVGDGLVVVAPHTGADVQIEPLTAVPWDGYGRLLRGGRGDGLGRSVAAAARRFAHPGPGERRRLAAGRAADALAAQRVQARNPHLGLIVVAPPAPVAAATVATRQLIPLASVRAPRAEGVGRVLGFALLMLLAAACLVWLPIRAIRPPNS
jgi:cell wall-associated NlpC family hydrolase